MLWGTPVPNLVVWVILGYTRVTTRVLVVCVILGYAPG